MGDISNSVRHIMLGKQAAYNFSVDKKKLLITALEPAIEWIMKCILMSCDQVSSGKISIFFLKPNFNLYFLELVQ